MRQDTFFSLLVAMVAATAASPADVVINEIHNHPAHTLPVAENRAEEYVELHNTDAANAVDLSGWAFDKGVTLTFPAGTEIAPGGFLIAAADRDAFLAFQPTVTAPVVGGWTGGLSNGGERLRLVDANGNTIDDVRYSTEGEWAQKAERAITGSEWVNGGDGTYNAISLLNPLLDNNRGHAWIQIAALTPGAANDRAEPDLRPMVVDVRHDPPVPLSTDAVTVTARVIGDNLSELRLRHEAIGNSPERTDIMLDDGLHGDGAAGDGVYGFVIPARPDGTVTSFTITAVANTGPDDVWPRGASGLFQADDEQYAGPHDIYQVVMTPADYQAHLSLIRSSDRYFNATFIAGDEIRYTASVRFRGNSSRSNNPPPIRIDLPADAPLDGSTKLNLNSVWGYMQVLGMRLFEEAGMVTPSAKAVAVRFNSVDRQGAAAPSYGVYAHIEPLGDEMIDRLLPREQQGGNMYKKQSNHNSDWGITNNYPAVGWEKRNNSSANDFSDLAEFHNLMNTPPSDPTYTPVVEGLIDVDQWLRWIALNNLVNNRETNLSNGSDDDYTMYRRSDDGRWILLPHDLDSLFGRGQSGSSATNETVFQMLTSFGSRTMAIMRPLVQGDDFGPRYIAQLDDLLETVLEPSRFDAVVDGTLPYVTESDRVVIKNFMRERRSYLLGLLGEDVEATTPAGGAVSTTGGYTLSGTSGLGVATILVNGESATIDRDDGRWSIQITPPQITAAVASGADWQYLDTGTAPPTGWISTTFNGAAWPTGAAPLGYGDTAGNVVTQIDQGGLFGFGKHTSAYFRTEFVGPTISEGLGAKLRLLYDDGVAVYLNGIEIARENLDQNAGPESTALGEVPETPAPGYVAIPVDPNLIVQGGQNVLAAELHISDPNFSPDSFFDAALEIDPDVQAGLALSPGINRLAVTALDAEGNVISSTAADVRYDNGAVTPLGGTLTENTTLEAAGGPYQISGDLIVPSGVTLTISPGTSLYFEKDAGVRVNGVLRALGEPESRIRFTAVPTAPPEADIHPLLPIGPPKWDGIQFNGTDSPENLIAYADIEHAQDSFGSVGVTDSTLHLQGCSFAGSHQRYVYTSNASMLIEGCIFPDMFAAGESPLALGLDNVSEHIKGVGGVPADGRYIIRGNTFGTNKGHNDVIDVDSSIRPAPILQVLGNVFHGAGDELLDIGGDVFVDGNVFQNVAKDADSTDLGYANAISSGDGATGATVVVSRNVFIDVDHAINLKRGDRTIFEYNTVVGINPDFIDSGGNQVVTGAVNLYVDEPFATSGQGAYLGENIFTDSGRALSNPDLPSGTTSALQFENNLLTAEIAAEEIGDRAMTAADFGTSNIVGAPGFLDADAGDFRLHPLSPAAGSGAMLPPAILIRGAPAAGITRDTSVTFSFGGPGMFAFRYRIDGGAWSADMPIGAGFDPAGTVRTVALEFSDLSQGAHTVEAVGQNFAGDWQADEDATAVSWMVDPTLPPVIISEVFADGDAANPDFVELQNLTSSDVSADAWIIGDSGNVFSLPPTAIVPAHGRLVVFADNAAAGPGLHAPFALDSDGDRIGVLDSFGGAIGLVEIGGALPGHSSVYVDGRWLPAVPTPGAPDQPLPVSAPNALVINEWLADTAVALDEEFIEIYNSSPLPVPLSGLSLGDGGELAGAHRLPMLGVVPGGAFLRIDAVGGAPDDTTAFEVAFRIANDSELLTLFDADGSVLDQVHTGAAVTDFSTGRQPDAGPAISTSPVPTPGLANAASASVITMPEVEIFPTGSRWNYLVSRNAFPDGWKDHGFNDSSWLSGRGQLGFGDGDEATVIDRGAAPYSLVYLFRREFTLDEGGPATYRAQMQRDDGAVINIDGVELARSNIRFTATDILHTTTADFALSTSTENIFVELPLGELDLAAGDHTVAVSLHQSSTSSSDISFDMRLFRTSLELAEVDPTIERAEQLVEFLRVSEVMYHAPGSAPLEYIELINISPSETLELGGVRLADAVDFTFPDMQLAPGEVVLVVENTAAFEAAYGSGLPIAGEFTGRLANGDDRVQLVLADPLIARVLDFEYDDNWLPATDGDGPALQIIDTSGERASWREPTSWEPTGVGGSPGFEGPVTYGGGSPSIDTDGNGLPEILDYALGTAGDGTLPYHIDANGNFQLDLPASTRNDIRYHLQTSSDLETWQTVATREPLATGWTGTLPATGSDAPTGRQRSTFDLPAATPFARIRIDFLSF